MRFSLLYNPFDLVERLAIASQRRRRFRRLRGTPAAALSLGHIESLELLELLADHPPQVIYDVGANVGTWTCLAKSLFPHARIAAFEPLAQHHAGFRSWTKDWPTDIQLHTCALGAERGRATMQITDFSDASSLLPLAEEGRKEFNLRTVEEQTVEVHRLDAYSLEHALPAPDLIKLDVQGYELRVLEGAAELLPSVRAILTEVSFRSFYDGQVLFPELLQFLQTRGFRLHSLGANLSAGQPLVQTDALFLRD